MKPLLVVTLDLLIGLIGLLTLGVLVSGGGVFAVGGMRISATSTDNLVVALAVLCAVRYVLRDWGPVFGRIPVASLSDALSQRSVRLIDRIEAASVTDLSRLVLLLCGAILLLKVALAVAHPGFFSGDDVEIHEMTLTALRGHDWPIWDLRSAVFPLGVIYPAQVMAESLGFTATEHLVIAGRMAVACFSTISVWLTWQVGRRLGFTSAGALLAAVLLAVNKLHISFGSTELPRPVGTVLLMAAFWLLLGSGPARALLAGMLIGLAATFRFSEAIFLVPAVVALAVQRRWRETGSVSAGFGLGALSALGLADHLYWGAPFVSVVRAFDYTVVHQLSSRGYEHVAWYFLNLGTWSTPVVCALALYGTGRRTLVPALWAWIPLVALCALPHKEARYLVPIVPFVCLLASAGLTRLASAFAASSAQPALRAGVVLALVLSAAHDAGGWRLRRNDADLQVAHRIVELSGPHDVVAIEQAWRAGGRLFLDGRRLLDLPPNAPLPMDLRTNELRPRVVAIRKTDGTAANELHTLGYVETAGHELTYRLFVWRGE